MEPPEPPPELEPKRQLSFVQTLGQRLVDSGDDIGLHLKRYFSKHELVDGRLEHGPDGTYVYTSNKPVILVLGFGWVAHAISKVIDIEAFDVVVVSPRNFFVFTPMLPSAAIGSVEFRSCIEPVRAANPYVTYFEGEAVDVDFEARRAICKTVNRTGTNVEARSFVVPYSNLVIGLGEEPATFGTPGVKDYCQFIKDVTTTAALRRRIAEQFENANFLEGEERRNALRFVVVGGGPTGCEFAGTMSDFIFGQVKRIWPQMMQDVEVVLVQSAPTILPVFDANLQTRAVQSLQKQNVRVMMDIKVSEVHSNSLDLSNGQSLEYGVCVWSTGNSSLKLTQKLAAKIPEQRPYAPKRPGQTKLVVDDFMRVIGLQNVFAAGDCSKLARFSLPPTAQVAGQQGAYVARTLNRNSEIGVGGLGTGFEPPFRTIEGGKGRTFEHQFDFLALGIMAYIGGESKAIIQAEPVGLDLWGRLASLLWRSVYITKQVSMRNRILILFDWLKSRVFGQDVSLF